MDTGPGKLFALLLALFLSSFLVPAGTPLASADAPANRHVLMGVMGDSLSAATFANTHITPAGAGFKQWPQIPGVVQNKATLSWASGEEIASHYIRLKEWLRDRGTELSVV